MHDINRTLAELTELDELAEEADFEQMLESGHEDFENFADYEFEDEGDFESLDEAESDFELADEADFEADSEQAEEADLEGDFELVDEADFETGIDHEGFAGFEVGATSYESDWEAEDEAESDWEAEDTYEAESEGEEEAGAFGEVDETELAAELLEIQDEAELEYFLGGVLKAVAKKFGQAISSPVGQQVVALLKQAAKKALPGVGTAIGGMIGGPGGAAAGGQLADRAAQVLGLELEGLTPEDQELEAAKGFVRLAADVAQEAAFARPGMHPRRAARLAMINAARRYAPGLLATNSPGPWMDATPSHGHGAGGRWVRVARNQIVLYGA